jgi:hypothetical protein
MADASKNDSWAWLGILASAIAVATFFGINNFTDLKHWLNGTPAVQSTPAPPTAPAYVPPTYTPPTCFIYCNEIHFVQTSSALFSPECSFAVGCPISAIFTNEGTEAGGASVQFTVYGADRSGKVVYPALAVCDAVIPYATKNEAVRASCTADSASLTNFWTDYAGKGYRDGVTVSLQNP